MLQRHEKERMSQQEHVVAAVAVGRHTRVVAAQRTAAGGVGMIADALVHSAVAEPHTERRNTLEPARREKC